VGGGNKYSYSLDAFWPKIFSMPKVFVWVIHLPRQLEFLFFDCFLADDIFMKCSGG
jgi:hypothetical protein